MTNFTPSKTILMWVNPDPQHPNSFIIKMDNQKLLGLTRTDKKGVTYWKFKERVKKEVNNPSSRPVVDNIQKFQQRQSQTKNHEQPNNSEPAINKQSN